MPENHLAGGYRIGQHGEGSQDQEFVLFSQGRHVLPESKCVPAAGVIVALQRLHARTHARSTHARTHAQMHACSQCKRVWMSVWMGVWWGMV